MEIKEIAIFTISCWLINISLNGLYVLKLIWPNFTQYDYPLDGRNNWFDGQRILGSSTTIPGILVALGAGLLCTQVFNYHFALGLLFGICVYGGHALGSFIKRRFKYKDGDFMPVVDHGDYVITTGLVMILANKFAWTTVITGILITYILHPIFTYLSYKLKLHKEPL